MADHIFEYNDLEKRLDAVIDKTLGEIDDKGIFNKVKKYPLQKGIAGTIIEQCVMGYEPDTKQEADLIVKYPDRTVPTELKTTGMVLKNENEYVAKEPMSITAVGIYDLFSQTFDSSHFWNKAEHMLLVYYLYKSKNAVTAYEYKDFPVKGYDFHEFTDKEEKVLRQDWENVRTLIISVMENHPGEHTKEWKQTVLDEYLKVHGKLRDVLQYIDLAPRMVPRFRFKKPFVNTIIQKKFGKQFSKLSSDIMFLSDIDKKCFELTKKYKGRTMKEIAADLGLKLKSKSIKGGDKVGETVDKSLGQTLTTTMFGGHGRMSNVEIFNEFGIIGKTIVLTVDNKKTEDMKFYHADFDEMSQKTIIDSDGSERKMSFEDSELYTYFSEQKFLMIIFKEPRKPKGKKDKVSLLEDIFVGFKLITFPDIFVNGYARKLWDDTRDKIINNKLKNVIDYNKRGEPIINKKTGEIKAAPNWMKKSENPFFIRGTGAISTPKFKTVNVNGIAMIPQNIWIDGKYIVDQLNLVDDVMSQVEKKNS